MRVAHLCLSCFYIDGYAYQENVLISEHLAQGHDVKVIASTEIYGPDKIITYTNPGRYIGQEGVEVIRLPYGIKPHALGRKLRWYPQLFQLLQEFKPDLIFFHGLSGAGLLDAAKYAKHTSGCRLVVDCHEDFNNSAKTFISRHLLHQIYYRTIFQLALPNIEKVFAVTTESFAFAVDFYGSPLSKTELLPLGGHLPRADELFKWRSELRLLLGFKESNIVIAQTGKFDPTKRLDALLKAFVNNLDADLRLILVGKMTPDVEMECMPLIDMDSRIHYLGWQNPDQLIRTLAAVDFFVQPFGQTVTTQQAMCSGCAILVQDLPSHRWLFKDNGRLFSDASDLPSVLSWVSQSKSKVHKMRESSYAFAQEKLDYKVISKYCIKGSQ